ncbi:hypothetical protein, partial [Pseudomonas aeruginosa]|uniref:hypothetical protein n=1 Tax=Pseudomonas aeruginosa TaxID=287 RepID=UPI003969626E
ISQNKLLDVNTVVLNKGGDHRQRSCHGVTSSWKDKGARINTRAGGLQARPTRDWHTAAPA